MLGVVASVLGAGAAPAAATDDPHWAKQWAPARIGAPAAWASTTGAGVLIGVVDTGIDLAHEDLSGQLAGHTACVGTGGDPARCAGSAQDQTGHGTHVAGIAAAPKDNGRGIAGIAPDAKLLVARVFDRDSASLDDVRAGIRWVVDRGAKVVNLSLETTSFLGLFGGGSADLAAAVEYAWSRGAIPVLAAGNASLFSSSANYGAANAVVVGATGRDDELAPYSVATGTAKWALLAPGGNMARGGPEGGIYSSYVPNRYAYIEGTSMAVPHVSGALALLLSRGLSPTRAIEVLLANADRRVGCGSGSPTCAGRLDVGRAVAATGPPVVPPPPSTSPPATAPPATAPPATAPPATAPPATAPPATAPPATAPPTTAPPAAPSPAPSTTRAPQAPATAAPTTSRAPGPVVPEAGPSPSTAPGASGPPSAAEAAVLGVSVDDADGSGAPAPPAGELASPSGPDEQGRPAGFRGAVALAGALLALATAGLVVRFPAR